MFPEVWGGPRGPDCHLWHDEGQGCPIRDVGRVLNMPYAEVDNIAKQVPFDLKMTLDKALTLSKGFSDLHKEMSGCVGWWTWPERWRGCPGNASTHAAGVVITRKPVYEYVPGDQRRDLVVTRTP